MDWRNQLRIFTLFLTCQILMACVTVSRHQHDDQSLPKLPNHTLIRIAADVVTESEGEAFRLVLTGSQPFSYHLGHDETASSLIMDIAQARFVDRPQRSSIGNSGVQHLRFLQPPGDETGARLQIELEPSTVYRLAKEPQRLVVYFQSSPAVPLAALKTLPTTAALTPSSATSMADYRVGPKDVLDITVYREPDLSKRYRVMGAGTISFPMIGKVNVGNLTMAEIEQVLESNLAQGYLMNPQVSVMVATYESQQVLVLGAVRNPGYYPLHGTTMLLEILSRAGGLKQENPHHQSIVVMRQHQSVEILNQEATVQTIRIDLGQLLSKGNMSLNIPLQKEDVVLVPLPASVMVFGEVKNPGAISLSNHTTLVEAISKAGGFTNIAASSRVRIVRTVEGIEKTMRVNVADLIKGGGRSQNIVLEPDDIVVVPASLF